MTITEAIISDTTILEQAMPEPEISQPIMSEDQKVGLLEALLLASGDPLSIARIQEILACTRPELLAIADSLQQLCSNDRRGIEVVVVAEKLQLRTKAIYASHVRQLMAVKPRRLSQAALETLAVIAYQQPVVKSEIDKVRGVDVAPTVKTLLERNLVKILGYQASVGQPALYGTTEEFLHVFGLPALSALPAMRDLKALVKEPGEAQSHTEDGGLEVAIPEEACDNAQALEATNNVFTPDLLGKSADQLDGIVTQ
ncbi:MAG: SMC-Scp complex subunit ScpB [Proteobacteria bacterium]|nr:SMC-Scp complex subunit ScpB [Pseudomonadota bacterium]